MGLSCGEERKEGDRIVMRKGFAALLLVLCVLLCGCGKQASIPNSDVPDASQSDVTPTPPVVTGDVEILSLQKQWHDLREQAGDTLLVQSRYSCVTPWFEDAGNYPQLTQTLEQSASMIRRSMEDEFDNLCAMAYEEVSAGGDSFGSFFSALDVQVRRADSVAVSFLSDSHSDYGWIEDFRGMHGMNYDAQTGEELALNDVINVNNELAKAVAKELNAHQWAGDMDYQDAVETYFANTPYDGIAWTLDYNGVTFYFADGDLEEPGNGGKTATVSFAEYPELFEEKYLAVPAAYMVELPLDSSYFTDLDGDGDLEELNITGYFDSGAGMYTKFGIYAEADGSYHYEDSFAVGFTPYYVKTTDGGHYLYLFCQEDETSGPIPMMRLVVFSLSNGRLTRAGEMQAAPGYIPDGVYRVPTDPRTFYLDDFEAMAQDMMAYSVGASGMPEPK